MCNEKHRSNRVSVIYDKTSDNVLQWCYAKKKTVSLYPCFLGVPTKIRDDADFIEAAEIQTIKKQTEKYIDEIEIVKGATTVLQAPCGSGKTE